MNVGQLIVQLLVVIVFFGAVYNLWKTAHAYGGLIGTGLKWIGIGMVFFSLEAIDRVLGDLSFIETMVFIEPKLAHDGLLLLGLLFSAIGFSRLTKISKSDS